MTEKYASMTVSKLRDDRIVESQVGNLGGKFGAFFALAMEQLGHDNLFRSCAVCKHWQEGPDGPTGCRIHRVLPPVKIIVLGCDRFEDLRPIPGSPDDEIPF